MQKTIFRFVCSFLFTTLLVASNKDNRNSFISLSMGISKFDLNEKDISGNLTLNNYPKDAGATYGVGLGYYLHENFFVTLNYERTNLENIDFHTFLTSVNYKFNHMKNFSPFVGVLVGYNKMVWDTLPIDTKISKASSSSPVFGIQIGNDTSLEKGLDFYIFYRYLWIDNSTRIKITPDEKEISHKHEHSLNLGVKFSF